MKTPIFMALAVLALVVLPANTQAAKIHPGISADTTAGNRVITHVAIVLNNLGNIPATFTLRFYGDSGNPQAFPFIGVGSYSVLTGTIPVGGQITAETGNTSIYPRIIKGT